MVYVVSSQRGLFNWKKSKKEVLCSRYHCCGMKTETNCNLLWWGNNYDVTGKTCVLLVTQKGIRWVMPKSSLDLLKYWKGEEVTQRKKQMKVDTSLHLVDVWGGRNLRWLKGKGLQCRRLRWTPYRCSIFGLNEKLLMGTESILKF